MTSSSFLKGSVFLSLLALAGCYPAQGPTRPPAGSSAAFEAGYVDACRTAYHDVQRVGYDTNDNDRSNPARYAAEPDYRAGWDRGYPACRENDLKTPWRYVK